MTGVAEADQEQQDAGDKLLQESILLALLLLRFAAGLRQISAGHLADLHAHVRAAIAKADIVGIPAPYRPAAARRLGEDIDAVIAGVYSRLLRDLQTELAGLA